MNNKWIVLGLNLLFMGGIPLSLSLFGLADFYHALAIMLLFEACVPTPTPQIILVRRTETDQTENPKYGPTTH